MLDELERVRAYRSDVPEPDETAVAAVRAELMEAIIREARPPRSRQRLRRLQRRRRFVLAGGLATVGVGIAGVLGFGTAATPVSALAAQMNQLAKVAANQAWSGIPGAGQYLYTESQGLSGIDTMGDSQECAVTVIQHRQSWIATNGSGAINETNGDAQFTSAADKAICGSAFHITDPASQDSKMQLRFPAGGLSFPTNDWKAMSTDPATLLAQVHRRDGGPNDPGEYFTNVVDFLRETDAPPAIRSALYQALALIQGVRLMGPQTDPTGGTGLGVGYYDGDRLTAEVIVDHQTAHLMSEEYFDSGGRLAGWYVYQPPKIVDSVPNYPMQQENQAPSSGTSAAPESSTTTAATATVPATTTP